MTFFEFIWNYKYKDSLNKKILVKIFKYKPNKDYLKFLKFPEIMMIYFINKTIFSK